MVNSPSFIENASKQQEINAVLIYIWIVMVGTN